MTVSFPSKPIVSINAPEVNKFKPNFVYNFFTKDERVDDSGKLQPRFQKINTDDFGKIDLKELDNVPRFVKFSWSSIFLQNLVNPTLPLLASSLLSPAGFASVSRNFIKKNYSKIHKEEEFTNHSFTGIEFQDTAIDGKLYLMTSGSVAKKINSKNIIIADKIDKNLDFVAEQVDTNNISLLDVAKFLAGTIGTSEISDQLIIDALTDLKSANTTFLDNSETLELIEDTFEKLKTVKTRFKVNNKFIKAALTTSATDPLGFFADEVGPLLSEADLIEKKAIGGTNISTIDQAEYEITVDPVSTKTSPSDTVFIPKKEHVGYVIDKFERSKNGKLIPLNPIILEQKETTSTIDFKVAYGRSYIYQIRAIYLVEFQTYSDNDDEIVISSILISSDASPRMIVECIESIAPPVPSDVNVVWDHFEKAPVVEWCFPINPQKDIKKWQVLRRESINDPFELQVEFNFDDSIISTRSFEIVDLNLIKTLISPQNFYVDKDFNREKTYIYTVCSIDAHGLSSNYGMQFEIKFNRFKNNIEKKLISNSGAPKPYPNMYLNTDTFVDTIKDSNHTKMKIYFDPEYLSVIQQGSQEEPLIATKQNNSSYRMQFINIDFQQSQVLDIIIKDRMKSKTNGLFSNSKNNKFTINKFYKAKIKD